MQRSAVIFFFLAIVNFLNECREMIYAIEISSEYGKLYIELPEPVETEQEALDIALGLAKSEIECADISEVFVK